MRPLLLHLVTLAVLTFVLLAGGGGAAAAAFSDAVELSLFYANDVRGEIDPCG